MFRVELDHAVMARVRDEDVPARIDSHGIRFPEASFDVARRREARAEAFRGAVRKRFDRFIIRRCCLGWLTNQATMYAQ